MSDFLVVGLGITVSIIAIVGIARMVEKAFGKRRSLKTQSVPEEIPLVLPDLPPSIPKVTYNENVLQIGSIKIELESKIEQVVSLPELILVLLDPFASPSCYEKSNFGGINYEGAELWRAELPSGYGIEVNPSRERYMKIIQVDPMKAYSWSGFMCIIDPSSGKIIESVFTK
jgi:hypothetical protein